MNRASEINPLPYPLDGLILYFLTSLKGDIMIHGSGVICDGKGWVFTGKSGSGKTTMAGIFDHGGDRVVHDDRLILVREGAGWRMHSTPVYRNDEPRSAEVDHLWIISHGKSNISAPLSGCGGCRADTGQLHPAELGQGGFCEADVICRGPGCIG